MVHTCIYKDLRWKEIYATVIFDLESCCQPQQVALTNYLILSKAALYIQHKSCIGQKLYHYYKWPFSSTSSGLTMTRSVKINSGWPRLSLICEKGISALQPWDSTCKSGLKWWPAVGKQ